MAKKSKKSPLELPQSSESWYFAIRRLRTWVNSKKDEPMRPYISIAVNMDAGLIQGSEIGEKPGVEAAQKTLFAAMLKPAVATDVEPHRPARVFFEDRELMNALRPALNEVGIQTSYRPMDEMNQLVKDLEGHLAEGEPDIPGLLGQRKVSVKMAGGFFASAAAFYQAAPWVKLRNEDVLSIQTSSQKKPFFAVVMGQAGVEYGLAIYKRWEDFERLYTSADDPDKMIGPDGMHSLFFNPMTEVPFDDLDAIEKYGWEVAGPEAYPVPLIFLPSEGVARPDYDELLWYEAALRAIPLFVKEHLVRNAGGEIQPSEADLRVSTTTGTQTVHIKYPGGELPQPGQRPFQDEPEIGSEFPFLSTRRAMEGDMARMFGGLSEWESYPKLRRAQEIMYDAWDERNPAKRIALAHKALKISKDCADAYVLLAEEEADTVQRAFEYFQEGIQAGERALGKAYFAENVGYFWGLLETRPYMRAMAGAAGCLWRMERKEEALSIFQEMLRLNPDDNQGIRYVLADLLLAMNREGELEALLKAYDDSSAVWMYTKALLAYRQSGTSDKSRRALRAAFRQNRLVPEYLSGKKRVPNRLPDTMGFGDDKEAASYAFDHLNYWRQTPGAVEWLQKELSALPPVKGETGKGKKSRKVKSSLQIGEAVVVKPGIIDPDFGTDLSGWQGRVVEVGAGEAGEMVMIDWDSRTLEAMPEEIIEDCEREGLDWAQMQLEASEVALTEPRDTPEERQAVFDKLSSRFAWVSFGEAGQRIQAVLKDVDPEDEAAAFEAWGTFLSQRLKLPFEAEVIEPQDSGSLRPGNRVKVTGIAEVDDSYGVLVNVEKKKFQGTIPLCDLEVVDTRSENYQPVEDYGDWFSNR